MHIALIGGKVSKIVKIISSNVNIGAALSSESAYKYVCNSFDTVVLCWDGQSHIYNILC